MAKCQSQLLLFRSPSTKHLDPWAACPLCSQKMTSNSSAHMHKLRDCRYARWWHRTSLYLQSPLTPSHVNKIVTEVLGGPASQIRKALAGRVSDFVVVISQIFKIYIHIFSLQLTNPAWEDAIKIQEWKTELLFVRITSLNITINLCVCSTCTRTQNL